MQEDIVDTVASIKKWFAASEYLIIDIEKVIKYKNSHGLSNQITNNNYLTSTYCTDLNQSDCYFCGCFSENFAKLFYFFTFKQVNKQLKTKKATQ